MASSVNSKPKNDVFLSWSGEDTCRDFTSNLHSALTRENITALISDDGCSHDREDGMLSVLFKPFRAIGLDRNKEDRESNLSVVFKAIENSKISVIIFSKDYASSERCLQELEKILECKKSKGQRVIPVFYHINPNTVRSQTGSFSNAFEKHEQLINDFTGAPYLYGFYVQKARDESKLIEEIVSPILKILSWDARSKMVVKTSFLPRDGRYKKVFWELIFPTISFFLQLLSAVFDQLSSPKTPQYTLYAMLISWLAVIFSIVDLVLKARKANVYWDKRKFWFCHPPPCRRNPWLYFGIFKDNIVLLCGLCQSIATTINYTDASKPIRISIWPITFALCVFCSQIIENLHKVANVRKHNE